ncbi:ATP-binding protein [Roseovarius sp. Pro17]
MIKISNLTVGAWYQPVAKHRLLTDVAPDRPLHHSNIVQIQAESDRFKDK